VRSEAASLSHQQPFAPLDQRSLVNGAAVVALAQEGKCVSVCECVCASVGMRAYSADFQSLPTQSHVNCSGEPADIAAVFQGVRDAPVFSG